MDSVDGVDSISGLPDEILHHILSFIPTTKFAITTSVLSKRWRHVWSETPHLSFEWLPPTWIIKTLDSYSASKITSFHLCNNFHCEVDHHVDRLIEFAMTHNVENLSLTFYTFPKKHSFRDCFYTNSSAKLLFVKLKNVSVIPKSIVSWKSLRNLSLTHCTLSGESFLKILSGCPILESLSLQSCDSLKFLDLTNSLRLRRLEIERTCLDGKSGSCNFPPPTQIVAPHIHYLRLRDCEAEAQCSFVDVSSLTQANVDLSYFHPRTCYRRYGPSLKPDALPFMVQTMLETFQNVEKLTLGVNFLQMLSLSKINSLPLPTLKVKNLKIEIRIQRSVVPGIAKLLQISPGLQKLTVSTNPIFYTLLEDCVNSNLDSHDLIRCWKWKVYLPSHQIPQDSEVVEPQLMATFMELLLANTSTLETLVVRLGSCIDKSRFEELYQMALTLSHNYKVLIVLK